MKGQRRGRKRRKGEEKKGKEKGKRWNENVPLLLFLKTKVKIMDTSWRPAFA